MNDVVSPYPTGGGGDNAHPFQKSSRERPCMLRVLDQVAFEEVEEGKQHGIVSRLTRTRCAPNDGFVASDFVLQLITGTHVQRVANPPRQRRL